MSGPESSGALAQKARALLEAARGHKKKVREHRTAARRCMEQFATLQAQAAAQGIRLEVA